MTRAAAISKAYALLLAGKDRATVEATVEGWRRGRKGIKTPAGDIVAAALARFASVDLGDARTTQGFALAAAMDLFRRQRAKGELDGALRSLRYLVEIAHAIPPREDGAPPAPDGAEDAPPRSGLEAELQNLLDEIARGREA